MQTDQNPDKRKSPRKILRRILWIASIILIGIVLIFGLIFFIIPYAASTSGFRELIESYASRALHRSVSIESIDFEWKKGLRVESIRISDDPDLPQTPMGSIALLKVFVDFPDLFKRGRLACEISLDAVTVRIVRGQDGKTNLQRFLAGLSTPKESRPAASDEIKGSYAVPVTDLDALLAIRHINILYEDRIQNRTAGLHDGSLDIHAPSLLTQPLSMKASAEVRSQGKPLSPLNAILKIQDLFDESARIQPDRMSIDMEVSAPGVQMTLKGNLSQKNLAGTGYADLEKVQPVLFSVLPEQLLPMMKTGRFEFTAIATQLDDARAAFDTHIRLKGIEIQASSDKESPLDPLTLDLNQKGIVNIPRGDLIIETGGLSLNSSRMEWYGQVNGLRTSSCDMRFNMGPSKFNLYELLTAAESFFKASFTFKLLDPSSPFLEIHGMEISGHPLQGLLFIDIRGISGSIRQFRVPFQEDTTFVDAGKLAISLPQLRVKITDFVPAEILANGSLTVADLNLHGQSDLKIDSLTIPAFRLETRGLRIDKDAPFGSTLPFSLTTSLEANGIQGPDLKPAHLNLSSLRIQGNLGSNPFAEAALKGFRLHVPDFKWRYEALGTLRGNLIMEAEAPHIRIQALNPLKGDIDRFQLRLLVDKGIEATLHADAIDLGRHSFKTDTSVTADLGFLSSILPDLFDDRHRLSGKAQVTCNISGRIPPPSALTSLSSSATEWILDPKSSVIESAGLSLNFSHVGGSWPLNAGTVLEVKSITTPTPFSYVLNGKNASGTLKGDIQIEAIRPSILPVADASQKPSPVSIHLAVTGEHNRLSSTSLSALLDIQPLGIKGETSFSVEGIDALLKSSKTGNPSAWSQFLSGTAKIMADLPETGKILLDPKTMFQGGFKAGAEIETNPNQGMRVKIWADTRNFDIEKENTLSIKNLNTALSFEKRYLPMHQMHPKKAMTDRLSNMVIQDRTFRQTDAFEPDMFGAPAGGLQSRLNPKPSIDLGPARFFLSPHVVPIRHAALDLNLNDGLPQIRRVEAHLLEGAIIGSARVSREVDDLNFGARLLFSDIDLKKMLESEKQTPGEEDSTIGGQLGIAFPLVSSLRQLIENLQLSLQFNHIGSRAFGRVLYLLDPYENNETIVSQRKLLHSGVPRWIDVNVSNGILSLDGEVIVKGVPIKIPHLERLNLAAVSGLETYEPYLSYLNTWVLILKIVSDPSPPFGRMEKIKTKR